MAKKISELADGVAPQDADQFVVERSADNNELTWAELKAGTKAYTDTLYPSGSGTSTGTNTGDQTSVSGNAGTATALATGRTIDGQTFDGTANITVIAPGSHAASSKATPVDADELPLVDSAASNVLKKLTWANLKATVKAYTDTLYPSGSGTSSGTNTGDQTSVSGNAGTATALQTARNIDGQSFDGTAAITVIAPGTHAATGKTTPVDADELPIVDSAASNVLKKLTWANLKATLKAYTDTLYPSGSGTSSGTNTGDQTTVSGNAGTATALQTARNIDGQSFDGTANITVIAPGTHAATGKTTPVDADELALVDSAASNVLKKVTWANVKATLKTYFDTLYPSGSGTSSGTNTGDQTISDATISTTDITTNNASTSKHGFLPKLDNTASHALDGTGAWSNPTGTQLDYVEITSTVTIATTADGNSGATLVVSGSSVAYDGSTRICVEFYAPFLSMTPGAAARVLYINLYDGTTDLGRMAEMDSPVNAVNMRAPCHVRRFLTPSNASHTYIIRGWKDSAGDTATVVCGAGGASAIMPAFIRITKA